MNTVTGNAGSANMATAPARLTSASGSLAHGADDSLVSVARPARRYARGEHIFHAGDRTPNVYLVESGSVKLYGSTDDGAEQIFSFCLPGEFFGLDVLGAPAHASSAAALEAAAVRALHVPDIRDLYRRVPAVQQRIHRMLSRCINDMYQQMLTLSRKHADERLAGFLLELDARLPVSQRTLHTLRLSMSRYEIGCHLGLTLETVSRLFRRFDEKGLTYTRARRIQLRDPAGLAELAGMDIGSLVFAAPESLPA